METTLERLNPERPKKQASSVVANLKAHHETEPGALKAQVDRTLAKLQKVQKAEIEV